MNRREFVGGLAGLVALSTASLEAALAGGRKTLVPCDTVGVIRLMEIGVARDCD